MTELVGLARFVTLHAISARGRRPLIILLNVTDQLPLRPDYARRHLQLGWWSIFVFAGLGLTLESLHGFKVAAYLDVSNETRRLMWRLAHAHGTLVGVLHVLTGLYFKTPGERAIHNERSISLALTAAGVLLPGGFFLGGFGFYAGDPGLGVLLVPFGALALLFALFSLATADKAAEKQPPDAARGGKGRRA